MKIKIIIKKLPKQVTFFVFVNIFLYICIMIGKNTVIEMCQRVHGDEYDYSTVTDVKDVNCKITYICPRHGLIEQILHNHLQGKKCLKCSYEERGKNKRISFETFIKKSKETHTDLSDYDFSELDLNKRDEKNRITINCKKHGQFQIRHNHFMNGQGCPYCSGTLKKDSDVIDELKLAHKDLDFSSTKFSERDTLNRVKVICPRHGTKYISYYNLINGQGCYECGREKSREKQMMTKDEFIDRTNKLHGDKYDLNDIDINNRDEKGKITVTCKKHGKFKILFGNFIVGHGCPKCNASKLENRIEKTLKENNIDFEYQKRFEWLGRQSLDFYLPKLNIAIECQGEQHFKMNDFFGGEKGFIKTIERDEKKRKLCELNGVKLLYFSDKEYNANIITEEHEILNKINGLS